MIHDLKCWPEYFQAVKSGIKPFELRKDDRGYAIGDILHLREYDPGTALYTGDEIDKTVTYVLPTTLFGALGEGSKYVIMGLAPRGWTPCAEGLPENSRYVLITLPHSTEAVQAYYLNGEWYNAVNQPISAELVIAWMPKPAPYNPDHIGDANGKVDQFREPTKMISEKLTPCKVCGCNYVITWEHHCIHPHKFYCQCAKCKQKTSEHENEELAKREWNEMQEVSADDHK